MASEVIIIDDTPPSSPRSIKKYFGNHIDLTNDNFSIENKSLWADKKGKSFKNTMNMSIIERNKSGLSGEVINLTTNNHVDTSYLMDTKLRQYSQIHDIASQNTNNTNMAIRHKMQYYPNNYMYNFKPPSIQIGNYCFPNYDSRSCLAPIQFSPSIVRDSTDYYVKNYIPTVKLNGNIKYMNPGMNQSPYYTMPDDYSAQFMPEFIDINNLMNYSGYNKNSSKNLSNIMQQTIESDTRSTAFKNNKRYNKNSVPLFLKRNRVVNVTQSDNMKVIDLSNDSSNDQIDMENIESQKTEAELMSELKDDDSDVVYVGAYAREPNYPTIKPTVYKLPQMDIEEQKQKVIVVESNPSCNIANSTEKSDTIVEKDTETDNKGKRKRKPVMTVPRRNPKRQVQIEKDYLKLLDNVIYESKKDAKVRKPVKKTTKNNSSDDNKRSTSETSGQNNKRTARTSNSCGAVYRPPSPLSKNHIRQWPVSGMHERPEFNPVSGKLEPFDSIIRNISATYEQQQQSKKENESENSKIIKTVENQEVLEDNKNLYTLCHEMLHHVFAYGATVANLIKKENGDLKENDKLNFMKDLQLMEPFVPLNLTTQNKPKSTDDNSRESEIDKNIAAIKELMQNSLLLYCLTNSDINRDHLAKYINSFVPEELIQWSNEKFNLME